MHLVQSSAQSRPYFKGWIRLLKALPRQVLSISKNSGKTLYRDNLVNCLTILTVKIFSFPFLFFFKQNLTSYKIMAVALYSALKRV